ncbi:MAG: hypothetical protein ACKVHU_21150 [Acidimicrobiales bacterium]
MLNDLDAGVPSAVDELGYLGNARYLATGDNLVTAWGRSPYRLGYSLVIAPLVGLSGSEEAAFTAVRTFNAVMIAAVFALLYLIVRRLLIEANPWTHVGIALAGATVPSLALYADTAFTEAWLTALVTLWMYQLLRLTEPLVSWLPWALWGVVGYYGYFSHGRFLPLLLLGAIGAAGTAARLKTFQPLSYMLAAAAMHVATRQVTVAGSQRVVSDVASDSVRHALEFPGAFASTFGGQTWTVMAATAALPIFGIAVLLIQRRTPDSGTRTFWWSAGIGCISLLAISSLFMAPHVSSRGELTFMVYERYVSVMFPILIALSLVVLVQGLRTGLQFERLVLVSLTIAGLLAGGMMLLRADLFENSPFFLNTPSLVPYWARGFSGLWGVTLAAVSVGLVAVAVLAWRRSVALLGLVILAALTVEDVGEKHWDFYLGERARQAELVEVANELSPITGATLVWDSRIRGSYFLYNYSWYLPDFDIQISDPSTSPSAEILLLSDRARTQEIEGVRLVMLEHADSAFGANQLGLYVLPGQLADELGELGLLAPVGFPAEIGDNYLNAVAVSLQLVDESDAALQVAAGQPFSVAIGATNTGNVPIFVARELGSATGATNVGIRLFDERSRRIGEGRAHLNHGLIVGGSDVTTFMYETEGLEPGRYSMALIPVVEGHRWLEDQVVEIDFEVLSN